MRRKAFHCLKPSEEGGHIQKRREKELPREGDQKESYVYLDDVTQQHSSKFQGQRISKGLITPMPYFING
jgi:hypothetical protein